MCIRDRSEVEKQIALVVAYITVTNNVGLLQIQNRSVHELSNMVLCMGLVVTSVSRSHDIISLNFS